MGFTGPEKGALLDGLGVDLTARGNVARDARWMTKVPGVFTAGEMQRGRRDGCLFSARNSGTDSRDFGRILRKLRWMTKARLAL